MNLHPSFSSFANIAMFQCEDGLLYTWGANTKGESGHGDYCIKNTTPTPIQSLTRVCSVACGGRHTLALTEDRKVYVWGAAHLEEFSEGVSTPQLVSLLANEEVIKIACGHEFSAVLTSQGKILLWGQNVSKCLATEPSTIHTPTAMPSLPSRVVDMACGLSHILVLTEDGTLYGSGTNNDGQLGLGEFSQLPQPLTKISENIEKIACGAWHSLMITKNGDLYSSGWNSQGSLGIGNTENTCSMTRVMGNVVSVATSAAHTLAMTKDGTLWAWGENDYGQLSVNTGSEVKDSPMKVNDLTPFKIVGYGCGWGYSYAVDEEGGVTIFGDVVAHEFGPVHKPALGKVKKPIPEAFRFLEGKWAQVYFWLFLGRSSGGSCFAQIPVEVIFHFAIVAKHL
jgi:alpha-tubulin suppressor-like RCC1 family protein